MVSNVRKDRSQAVASASAVWKFTQKLHLKRMFKAAKFGKFNQALLGESTLKFGVKSEHCEVLDLPNAKYSI